MHRRNKKNFIANSVLPLYLNNALLYMKHIFNDDLFAMITTYFSPQKKERLLNAMINYAKTVKLDIEYTIENYRDGTDTLDETLLDLFRKWKIRNKFQSIWLREFSSTTKIFDFKDRTLINRIEEIRKIFKLSELDAEIIQLAYYYQTYQQVNQLAEIVNEYLSVRTLRHGNNLPDVTIAAMLGQSRSKIQKALMSSASLSRFKLLDEEHELSPEIVHYLEGLCKNPVIQNYYRLIERPALPLNEFFVSAKDVKILTQLYRQRKKNQAINILLYGAPGTGKTEFALSLSHYLGASLYAINANDLNNERIDNDANNFRIRSFAACQNTIENKKAVILLDEADSMLNSIPSFFLLKNSADKGLINSTLDESKSFTIWITNYIDGMDDSTKRRFNYAINFKKMNIIQRMKVWQYKIEEYHLDPFFSCDDIEYFAENYEINAGNIDLALQNLSIINKSRSNKQRFNDAMEQILRSQYRLIHDKEICRSKKDNILRSYSLDGLNVTGDLHRSVETLKQFSHILKNSEDNLKFKNLNVLLFGPPGTGKTEFVHFIARTLKRKLHIKRGSDILSPYIGMTERLIREAFEEAQDNQSILFLDEIDSLLFGRGNANRSWEMSQVNELLNGMENFNGILMAATNFKHAVDQAAIRRFSIKLEFDYLTPEGNLIFYNRFFGEMITKRLSESETSRIQALKFLTPGDFKVIAQQYQFTDPKKLSHIILIEALSNEVKNKNEKTQTIGFEIN